MVQPILMFLFEHQEWYEWMVADVGDPAGWVANRDINQVFVEFSMGGLDDGKGLGGIF